MYFICKLEKKTYLEMFPMYSQHRRQKARSRGARRRSVCGAQEKEEEEAEAKGGVEPVGGEQAPSGPPQHGAPGCTDLSCRAGRGDRQEQQRRDRLVLAHTHTNTLASNLLGLQGIGCSPVAMPT